MILLDTHAAVWLANDNPALGAAIVGQRRDVLNDLTLQDVHEEVERGIIVPHDQCNECKVRHQVFRCGWLTVLLSDVILICITKGVRCR